MTEAEKSLRQQYVNKCISFYGAKESDGSHRTIVNLYNTIRPLPAGYRLKDTDAWCAAFVSAAAEACDLTDIIFPECSCDRMIALYKKAGRWQENDAYANAQMGDLVMYDWQDSGSGDNTGSSDHVGVVVTKNGSKYRIIEGNMSDSVGYREITVNAKYIRGFCLPDFAGKAKGTTSAKVESTTSSTTTATSTTTTTQNTATVTTQTCTVKALQIRRGCTGAAVKAAQAILVHCYGYNTGGIDGEFGSKTYNAVVTFQRANGLTADGVIGPATWAKLLGR